jgi:hypothetical protein
LCVRAICLNNGDRFHVFCWGVPLAGLITMLSMKKLGADGINPFCQVRYQDKDESWVDWVFYTSPSTCASPVFAGLEEACDASQSTSSLTCRCRVDLQSCSACSSALS